jgi:hypothetical protein
MHWSFWSEPASARSPTKKTVDEQFMVTPRTVAAIQGCTYWVIQRLICTQALSVCPYMSQVVRHSCCSALALDRFYHDKQVLSGILVDKHIRTKMPSWKRDCAHLWCLQREFTSSCRCNTVVLKSTASVPYMLTSSRLGSGVGACFRHGR